MQNEDILEALRDEDFLNELIKLTDIEEVKKAFKSKGIDITDQDIEEMRRGAFDYMNNTEFPEELLDNIVGGAGTGNSNTPMSNIGAFMVGVSIRGGIKNGWLAPM
ncbi:MAG: hypothetical protein LBR79_07455 [Oscillospiraceae bacterium]|nr:hypothetical protein [Oscillospiraceae bacterium]